MGSRLGTHTFWTVALSATICLLALSPAILRYETPLERLPGPLAGVVQVGRVVTSSLSSRSGDEPAEAAPAAAPAPEPAPPSVADEPDGSESGSGVLGGRAGETGASGGDDTPTPRDGDKPKHGLGGPRGNDDGGTPAPAPVPDDDDEDDEDEDEDDEDEGRADDDDDDDERAGNAVHKTEKNEDKAEHKAKKKAEKKQKDKDKDDDEDDDDD